MKKYLFFNDYSEGAHPTILKTLGETNNTQELGYGEDIFSKEAAKSIRKTIGNDNCGVHFVSGGTQANLIVLSSLMKPYESVISAESGHINMHEAGAIEATGHKIETINSRDGKLKSELMEDLVNLHQDEHTTKPRVVFISNSTEVGTIYNKKELENLYSFCNKNNLYLYLDGARLGSALTAKNNDLTLNDISLLTDAFYIGGTKNGALLGEAVVITNNELKKEFRRSIKQRGALLAKGRVMSIQFLELFKNNLFFDIARHANSMAEKLTDGIKQKGYKFLTQSPTNQIFPIFPNDVIKKLEELYGFYLWEKVDEEKSAIRLVTSWATKESAVDEFLKDLRQLR